MQSLSQIIRKRDGILECEVAEWPEFAVLEHQVLVAAASGLFVKRDRFETIEVNVANGWAVYKVLDTVDRVYRLHFDHGFLRAVEGAES